MLTSDFAVPDDIEYEVYNHNTFLAVKKRSEPRRSRSCEPRISLGAVHQPTPEVFAYLAENVDYPNGSAGMTVMLRDVEFKTSAGEFVGLLSELNTQDVEYAYLPQVTWKSSAPNNKGFGFVHFNSITAALAFTRSVSNFHHPMRTADAKLQGMGMNMRALLEMQDVKGRTEKIVFHARYKDKLYCIVLRDLRTYLYRRS